MPLIRPGVAFPVSAAVTWAGVADGFVSRYRAAAPATCGVAIDVPLIVFVDWSPLFQSDVVFTPGAKMSTQGPTLENDALGHAVGVAAARARDVRPMAEAVVRPEAIVDLVFTRDRSPAEVDVALADSGK